MRLITFLLLLVMATSLQAQTGYSCIVSNVVGSATVQLQNSSSKEPLLPGPISPDATIILEEGAKVVLVLENRSIVLSEAGQFSVKKYAEEASTRQRPNFFSRYLAS